MIELPYKKQFLPPFRQDLQLFQGPDEPDGAPSFNLLDPVKGQYYKITWGESLIIKLFNPGMSVEDLCHAINLKSTLKVTADEVKAFFEDAHRYNLLVVPKSSERVLEERDSVKVNPIKWLVFHYLYIRVPLFDPNRFLKKTLPLVMPLFSYLAIFIYITLSLIGVAILLSRFEEFIHTFPYFFNIQGALFYALALTAMKIIHELSHAYTAVHYGVRVPAMGVAFLVLWPVLFTDVTDGWRLSQRRHRLMISLAGIISECIIAGLCTFGWVFTNPGLAHSIFFVIASISLISTLLVNSNPAMRFDGYYILGDLWGVDNLQSRAFSLTTWKMREWLWGLKMPEPEKNLSTRRMAGMVVYALYTWTYRLFLYTAIAIFVYYKFTKALGIFLFLLEISVFLLWPLISEINVLIKLRGYFTRNPRLLMTSIAIVFFLLWFIIPLPRREAFPGITVPTKEQILYVPYDARVEEIFVSRNQNVAIGQPIIKLASPELSHERKILLVEEEILKTKIKILGFDDENHPYLSQRKGELEAIQAQSKGLDAQIDKRVLVAELDGQVFSWDENLRPGQTVPKDKILGKITNTNSVDVICFVPEALLHLIKKGQKVDFVLTSTHKTYTGTVESINSLREDRLNFPSLASNFRGDLPVVEDSRGTLLLIESYYPVRINLGNITPKPCVGMEQSDCSQKLRYGELGNVKLIGPSRSLLVSFGKELTSLFWKESGI